MPYADVADADYEVNTSNGFCAYVRRRSQPGERFVLMQNHSEAHVRWLLLGIKKAAGLPEHFSPQE